MDAKCEFFKALYWKFDGDQERLTTYAERDLPDADLTRLAFERARMLNCIPSYMRVFVGQFLRHGDDDKLSEFTGANQHV